MKPRALLLNLSLLAAGWFAATLAAEVALRTGGRTTDAKRPTFVMTEYDSLFGWRLIPNGSGIVETSEYSVSMQFNSHGIRGPEYRVGKSEDEYRILLLGDSFAQGYTVDFEELSSQILKKELNDRGDHDYEVINAGTAGYSTDQELLFFEHKGSGFEPDLTVLLFYVNDVWFNSQTVYWRGFKPRYVLSDDSLRLTNIPVPPPDPSRYAFEVPGGTGIVRAVRRVDAWLGTRMALHRFVRQGILDSAILNSLAIRLGLGSIPNEWRPWKTVTDPELGQAWRVTEELLKDLRRQTAEAGSELVIFWVPAHPVVDAQDWSAIRRRYAMRDEEWSPDQDGKVLREICARNDLDCVIPHTEFETTEQEYRLQGKSLYYVIDAHWNANGHRLAGELLAEHIGVKYMDLP